MAAVHEPIMKLKIFISSDSKNNGVFGKLDRYTNKSDIVPLGHKIAAGRNPRFTGEQGR